MTIRHSLYPVSTTIIDAATSQSIDIRGGSAVEIRPQAQAVWAKLGDSTVTATAGTASEIFCPVNEVTYLERNPYLTHVAIIQDAATADGSVTVVG